LPASYLRGTGAKALPSAAAADSKPRVGGRGGRADVVLAGAELAAFLKAAIDAFTNRCNAATSYDPKK